MSREIGQGEGLMAWRIKTGDIRDIPMNDFLGEVLKRHPRHIATPYVFQNPDGGRISKMALRRRIKMAGEKSGLPVHVYPHLGCYGDPFVETPHLDALAAAGVRFANAYTLDRLTSEHEAIVAEYYQENNWG